MFSNTSQNETESLPQSSLKSNTIESVMVLSSVVPSSNLATDASTNKINQKTLVQSKSLALESRPIYPNCQYSPYGTPTNSPREKKKSVFRESRRISIDKSGMHIQLNQYKLMDAIAQGSYGIVKIVKNVDDGRLYAMKILSKTRLIKKAGLVGRLPKRRVGRSNKTEDLTPLDRVYREIAVLKKLNHPNVVKLVEVLDGSEDDDLYLVFELLEKQILDVPTEQPLSEETTRLYFRDVILGIEYLHYQRIIHRDIKPANLLLTSTGRVQIADFGICNEFVGSDAYLSSTIGTPAFIPPEALAVGPYIAFSGKAADIWAMGVTLYSLVYGHVPFKEENIAALYSRIKEHPIEFPPLPQISLELKNLIRKMLVKNPEFRITLPEIKVDPWITKNGSLPMPSEEENCQLVEITEEDVAKVVTQIPNLQTLILIKQMLRQHSFQNPYSKGGSARTMAESKGRHCHIGRSGRSHSAPGSYNDVTGKQLSFDSLESVQEVNHNVESTSLEKETC